MSEFAIGDAVLWRREGYPQTISVPAMVSKIGPKCVQIAARRKNGTQAFRWVKPSTLRPLVDSSLSAGDKE